MTAGQILPGVAAYGLPGSRHSLPSRPLEADAWTAVIAGVTRERLAGHLVEAVLDGALPTTDEQAEQAASLHTGAMMVALRLERVMLETLEVLDQAGLDCRVIKGPALAHGAYPNPALRVFGDIDLLVPGEQFDTAIATLQAYGCTRRFPQLRPNFDRRFGKGAALVTSSDVEIDLHRTFVLGPFGLTIDLDGLFASTATLAVGGRKVSVLPIEEQFISACYHSSLGSPRPRLVPLRDIAQLLLATTLNTDRVLEVARSWQGEAPVALAIRNAWATLDLADALPLTEWAFRYQPTAREERALAAYRRAVNSYGGKAVASLRAIPGVLNKAAFLRAVAFPDRRSISRYEHGLGAWWGRGARGLLRRGTT